MKCFERPWLGFLSREQMLAVLALPGTAWLAERERLMLNLLYDTGARVSERVGIKIGDAAKGRVVVVHEDVSAGRGDREL